MIVLGHLSAAQRRAYHSADNKLTEMGSRDEAVLSAELQDLLADDFDLLLVGFSDGELDKLLADLPEGDGGDKGRGGRHPRAAQSRLAQGRSVVSRGAPAAP